MNEMAMLALLSRPVVAEMATPLEQVALLLAEEQKAQAAKKLLNKRGLLILFFCFCFKSRLYNFNKKTKRAFSSGRRKKYENNYRRTLY